MSAPEIIGLLAPKRHGQMLLGIIHTTEPARCAAIKATSANCINGCEEIARRALNEKKVLLSLMESPSEFIVSYLCSFADSSYLYLGISYVGGGDLFSRLMPEGGGDGERLAHIGQEETALYAAQIVLALEHLHTRLVMHRNLKLENLLIGMDGFLVLTDFSLAKHLEPDHSPRIATLCGSPEYMAPEIILGREYDHGCDYWALGCIVHELLTGQTPFAAHGNVRQIVQNVLDGAYSHPPTTSDEARSLIDSLCALHPPLPKSAGRSSHCRLHRPQMRSLRHCLRRSLWRLFSLTSLPRAASLGRAGCNQRRCAWVGPR